MNLSSRKKRIILEIFLTVAIMCELLYAIATKEGLACIMAFCLGVSLTSTIFDISIYKTLHDIEKELDKAMREAKEITQRENVDDILKAANENLKEEETKENV